MTVTIVAEADLEKRRTWLWSDYRHKDRIKMVPGSRFDSKLDQWHVPLTWAAAVQLRGVFGDELGLGPQLNGWASTELTERVQPALAYRDATVLSGSRITSLYPFQQAGVAFLITARQALLADDMGCIQGDAVIGVNRAGKGFKMDLATLVSRFRGEGSRYRWNPDIVTKVQYSAEDGTIRLVELADAWHSGVKTTYTVTTDSGRQLRATDEHPFLTVDGWMRLDELSASTSVVVRGSQRAGMRRPKIRDKYTHGMAHHPYRSKFADRWCVIRHRLIAEAALNGVSHDEFKKHIMAGEVEGFVFMDPAVYVVHHRNGDHQDNSPDNLEFLTHEEHRSHHSEENASNVLCKTTTEKIESVKLHGEEATYDLEVKDSPHNFLANGFVVHNTGKTVQLASTLDTLQRLDGYPSPFPCLIVAPKAVKEGWRRELERWCSSASVVVAKGNANQRRDAILSGADIVVVNYETARDHSRLAHYGSIALSDKEKQQKELNQVPWSTVIVDEAHRIRNPQVKWTRACWYLAHRATYRYALTGTPVANDPGDLWSVMHLVAPEEYPARSAFVDRYCLTAWSAFGGVDVIGVRPEHRDELFKILHPRMRRMTKDLVLSQLPPKVREVRECEMTPKQARSYREMVEKSFTEDETGDQMVAGLPVTKRLRLMQFASACATLEPTGELNEDGEPRTQVRLSAPSSKVDALIELLGDLEGEPVVAFAQSRQLIQLVADRLDKEGITYRQLVGGMTEDERARHEREFMQGSARVMLGTISAAGEGVTLTRARYLVFLQRADSMLMNRQAEDRVYRIGAEGHSSVVIVDLVTPGTVEVSQIESLHLKFDRLQEIVRDREQLQAHAAAGDELAAQRLHHLDQEAGRLTAS